VLVLAFAAPAPAAIDTTPLPPEISGAGGTTSTSEPAAEGPSGGSAVGRLVLGLVVVGGLIFVVSRVLKRANRERLPGGASVLDVVTTTPLGQNRALHLVRVGDELHLVGSAEQGVTSLRVYDAREAGALEATLALREEIRPNGSSAGGPLNLVEALRRRTAR
jgi:flagellar protein FliO/FliZ